MGSSPEDMIIASVIDAISEQRLPAGAKLGSRR